MDMNGLLKNRQFTSYLIILGVFTLLLLCSNIFVAGGDGFFNVSNTLISATVALAASFLFFKASANKKDTASRFIWLWMGWGIGLWALADTTWAFYSVVLRQTVPFPSIADLLWTAGYIPLYIALILRLRSLKIVITPRRRWLLIGLQLPWVVLTATFILAPILVEFNHGPLLEGILNLLYPLADLGLVVLAFLILTLLNKGRFAFVWQLILSGILLMTFSDLLFSYGTWNNLYYPGDRVNLLTNLTDTTYSLAYIGIALGIFSNRFIWNLDKAFNLQIETIPSIQYEAFAATDDQNKLIVASNNFYCLIDGNPADRYAKMPLDQVLGIQPGDFQALIERVKGQGILNSLPLRIATCDGRERHVRVTALAVFNLDKEFEGVNFALNADLAVAEDLRAPKSGEIRDMLNYLLSVTGARSAEEILGVQNYFLEVIRLLASLLNQFGGEAFRGALFEELNRTISQMKLPMEIEGQVIRFHAGHSAGDLVDALVPLMQVARQFTIQFTGEQIVNNCLCEIKKPCLIP